MFNDLGSGSNVDLCIITPTGVEYLRNHEMLQAKTYARQFPQRFSAGSVGEQGTLPECAAPWAGPGLLWGCVLLPRPAPGLAQAASCLWGCVLLRRPAPVPAQAVWLLGHVGARRWPRQLLVGQGGAPFTCGGAVAGRCRPACACAVQR